MPTRDGTAARRSTARRRVDSGAYSSYPFSACLEAAQVGSILPGPYKMERYRCRTWSVATNKPPILPYRGVARTGVCFALEVMLDAVARELGAWSRTKCASRTSCSRTRCRTTTSPSKHFDCGDYPEAVRRAVDAHRRSTAMRARQKRGEPDGRRIGVGFAIYCEQARTAPRSTTAGASRWCRATSSALARLSPDGVLELRIGAHSHGQGMETTLAQVAHAILGIDRTSVRLVHGDTGLTPYSTGTWGSRCMVMSGGAVAAACDEIARAREGDRREAAGGRAATRFVCEDGEVMGRRDRQC